MFAFERTVLLRDVRNDLLTSSVHELEGGEDFGELLLGFDKGTLYFLERLEAEEGDIFSCEALRTKDRNDGDDADSALPRE